MAFDDVTAAAPWLANPQQPPQKPRRTLDDLIEMILSAKQPEISLPTLPPELDIPQPPAEPKGFWEVLNRRFLPGFAAGLTGKPVESIYEEEQRPYRTALENYQLRREAGQGRFQNQAAITGLQAQMANLGAQQRGQTIDIAQLMGQRENLEANRAMEQRLRMMMEGGENRRAQLHADTALRDREMWGEIMKQLENIRGGFRVDAAAERAQKRSNWMAVLASLFKPDPIHGGVVKPDEDTLAFFLSAAVNDGALADDEAKAMHESMYPPQGAPPAVVQDQSWWNQLKDFLTPQGAPSKPLKRLGPYNQPF